MTPTDRDIEILRAIQSASTLTAVEMEQSMPQFGDPRKTLERLWSNKFLDCERIPSRPGIYTVAAKGRRLLMRLQTNDKGEMPEPRRGLSTEPYRGEKALPVRPGSMDAFDKPHLINGERLERTRPALIGARALEVVGVHGGRA